MPPDEDHSTSLLVVNGNINADILKETWPTRTFFGERREIVFPITCKTNKKDNNGMHGMHFNIFILIGKSGHEIAPNTGANATKSLTLATKS